MKDQDKWEDKLYTEGLEDRLQHLGRKELASPVAEAIRKAQLAEEEPESEAEPELCEECGRKLTETEVEEYGDVCDDCFSSNFDAMHPAHPDRRGR